jgi:hypothetical protein
MDLEFKDIEVVSKDGLIKVVLEYIGEGYQGDYDPKDSEDEPLLRYSLYQKDDDGDWDDVDCGSYCTYLSVNDDRDKLVKVANTILRLVEDGLTSDNHQKFLYERLSHINIDSHIFVEDIIHLI